MNLRITKVDEFQFLTCVKHQVWGSKIDRFKHWQIGDYLAIIVDKQIAGLAKVDGKPYVSKEIVWDNGLFPHRIPIKFAQVMLRDNRLPILGEIREALISCWGPQYGFGILNQQPIPENVTKEIIAFIQTKKNDLNDVQRNIEAQLNEAKLQRDQLLKPKRKRVKTPPIVKEPEVKFGAEESIEEPLHSKAQYLLVRLGRATKCSVWIASNDQNKTYMGNKISNGCLKSLPNLGLSEEATRRIKLIDAIWLYQNAPICAFEVETTTSIYSGLLRLSDLISVVPAINIKLFIVAPIIRRDKVMAELSRPTFHKIGLSDYCRFIAIEDLESLLSKVEEFVGHFQPSIIDTVALGLEGELETETFNS